MASVAGIAKSSPRLAPPRAGGGQIGLTVTTVSIAVSPLLKAPVAGASGATRLRFHLAGARSLTGADWTAAGRSPVTWAWAGLGRPPGQRPRRLPPAG